MRCGSDDWTEVDLGDLSDAEIFELWDYVASGDVKVSAEIVAEVLDVDDDEICDVDMVADPCELKPTGHCYRAWYRRCAEV